MAKESKSLDDLVTEKKRTKWYIESGQMAEGSREYMQDRLISSMSSWLKEQVGEDDCFAVVVKLALTHSSEINQATLGFPSSELQSVADGFQYVSNRRTDLVHPTKELRVRSEQDEDAAYARLWAEIWVERQMFRALFMMFYDFLRTALVVKCASIKVSAMYMHRRISLLVLPSDTMLLSCKSTCLRRTTNQ